MLWTFVRRGVQMSYEVRRTREKGGFELVLRTPDGHEEVEHYDTEEEVHRRAEHLHQLLVNDGWFIAGDPRR
jgi:hypothetical protein